MIQTLLWATVATDFIATSILLLVLYLPLVWHGKIYDVLGALGSTLTRKLDNRARLLGALIYFGLHLLVTFLYGLVVASLMRAEYSIPGIIVNPGGFPEIDLFYPLLGLAIGFGHGILVGFILTIVVAENHPFMATRSRFGVVISQAVAHVFYGAAAMFSLHQFLQLSLQR